MVMRKGGHYAQKLLRNNCNYIHHCGLPGAGKYYQYLWREPRSFLAGPGGDCQRDPTCVGIDWRTGLTDLPVEPPCRKSCCSFSDCGDYSWYIIHGFVLSDGCDQHEKRIARSAGIRHCRHFHYRTDRVKII